MFPISVVVVAHQSGQDLFVCLDSVAVQSPSEIIVVAQHPDDNEPYQWERLQQQHPKTQWTLLPYIENNGFAGGANRGAAQSQQPWMLFLNPDSVAQPGALQNLLSVAQQQQAAIVGAQIVLPDGTTNAGDNPLHPLGLSWSGRYTQPLELNPPRRTLAVSGCCMLVEHAFWKTIGGFKPEYFMYCEDTDLCWRAALSGRQTWFVPQAQVVHNYEFSTGHDKWYWLEQNRWQMLLSNYSRRQFLRLLPWLLLLEIPILMKAAQEGWLNKKLQSYKYLWVNRVRLKRQRQQIPHDQPWPDMHWNLDSPVFDSPLVRRVDPWLQAGLQRTLQVSAKQQREGS